MPAGMSFLQLEGNYVISFRDTSDCLPAFTAVRLDRRRGSLDSGVFLAGSSGALASSGGDLQAAGLGPRGSISHSNAFGGSARDLRSALSPGDASPTTRRQRSGSLSTTHKFVITGIPRTVSTNLIRTRLEDSIPGIERVYRDPDMANKLTHPPVILETRLAYARDAFMLRTDWIPVVQRIIKAASDPNAASGEDDDADVRFDVPAPVESGGSLKSPESRDKDERRLSLLQLGVTCPHGRYRGDNTCLICRHQNRRLTFVADDFLTHAASASGPVAEALKRPHQRSQPPQQPPPQQKPAARSKWACSSCMACLFRVLPRWSPQRPEEPEEPEVPEVVPPVTIQVSPPPAQPPMQRNISVLSCRRSSTYDDVRPDSYDELGGGGSTSTASNRTLRV